MLAKFCAEKFHDARIKRNMTQEELAEKAGISSRYLRALESGQKKSYRLGIRILGGLLDKE